MSEHIDLLRRVYLQLPPSALKAEVGRVATQRTETKLPVVDVADYVQNLAHGRRWCLVLNSGAPLGEQPPGIIGIVDRIFEWTLANTTDETDIGVDLRDLLHYLGR